MQNIVQGTTSDSQKSHEKQSAASAPPAAANVHYETGKTSNSSPTKSEIEALELQPRLMMESEEDSVSEVLLAMNANIEDRGIKSTHLMEAASAGHVDIVRLLIAQGADVNAQSTSGNTPLMYGCAGGHEEVVCVLLEARANVEDHNENGHSQVYVTFTRR